MVHSMIQLIPHKVVPLGHSQANGVVLVTVAALGAALLFALASVLQHRSAERESEEATFRMHHMGRLVLRPMWLAGILADAGGYVLQFIALRQGTLVVVQVLLISGLLFALPLAAAFNRRRPRAVELAGALAVVCGLALFLVVAQPAPGFVEASNFTWGLTLMGTLVPAGGLVALAGREPGIRRAVLLAAASGIAYGLTAALTKATADLLSFGWLQLLLGWQTYALAVIGLLTLYTTQKAFHAGPLRASLPTLSVVDPMVSIIIGSLALGESISTVGLRPAIEVLALALLTVGVVILARSTLVSGEAPPPGNKEGQANRPAPQQGGVVPQPPTAHGTSPSEGATQGSSPASCASAPVLGTRPGIAGRP
jgi:drug/metabolite transporter (DMT)-like permease